MLVSPRLAPLISRFPAGWKEALAKASAARPPRAERQRSRLHKFALISSIGLSWSMDRDRVVKRKAFMPVTQPTAVALALVRQDGQPFYRLDRIALQRYSGKHELRKICGLLLLPDEA